MAGPRWPPRSGALIRRARASTGTVYYYYHHRGSKAGLRAVIDAGFYDGLVHASADAHLPSRATWAEPEQNVPG